MNIYFCDAGRNEVIEEIIDYWPRYEQAFVCGVVAADSPGQAKSIFLRTVNGTTRYEVEFTGIAILKLGVDDEIEAGALPDNSQWWMRVPTGRPNYAKYEPRHEFQPWNEDVESDQAYVLKNLDLAVALLDRYGPLGKERCEGH